MASAEIGIFGGTGVYDPGLLENSHTVSVKTPYGKPSSDIVLGRLRDRDVAFLPRHGTAHTLAPHLINYRANVWAFQSLGVKRIVAPSAVGSLRRKIKPGHFAIPSQFIDNTRTRVGSYTEEGKVIHISVADPFCPELTRCIRQRTEGVTVHDDCTYVCIEGPRFSTKAESRVYQNMGADIIGMTLVPECQLSRESRICYASVSMITDYDVWADEPVTAKEVASVIAGNSRIFKGMLPDIVDGIPAERHCSCGTALDDAIF